MTTTVAVIDEIFLERSLTGKKLKIKARMDLTEAARQLEATATAAQNGKKLEILKRKKEFPGKLCGEAIDERKDDDAFTFLSKVLSA